MSHHLLDDDDDHVSSRNERELTLSTGSILGIFFGLVLVCGLFFGFGYNMGRKSTTAATRTADAAYDDQPSTNPAYTASKPSAGSTIIPSSSTEKSSTTSDVVGAPRTTPTAEPVVAAPQPKPKSTPAVAAQLPPTPTRAPMPPNTGTFSTGNFVVQVAAVSHQEDADLLVGALQRKGYAVTARSENGDKLVHIQVGPFSDHKQADTMKARLITDGYNAMIKQL